jgi:hypothetical protein
MNLAGTPLPFNQVMRAAYKAVGVPLWVTPQEAADTLRHYRWSQPICLELGEWFARVWSMAFASGYRGRAPFTVDRDHVLRLLSRMGYGPARAAELASVLLDNLQGLYTKGCERRYLRP